MAFNGKLLELKTGNSYVEFPLKYIQAESYKVTPDQRMEASATRATSGILVRTTVTHTASKIEFNTTPLQNKDITAIDSLLSNAYTDSAQRKLNIRYYHPPTDSYKTGTVYVPDIEYEIVRVDANANIVYFNPTRIAFIEY